MTLIPEGFWSTAAQVIPTLLLVLVIERRFTNPDRGAPKSLMIVFVTAMTVFAAVAEFIALRNVALGHGTTTEARGVIIAVGVMVTVIVTSFLTSYAQEHADLSGTWKQRAANHAALMFVGAASLVPVIAGTVIAFSI